MIRAPQNISRADDVGLASCTQLFADRGASEARIEIGAGTRLNSNVRVNADLSGTISMGHGALIGPKVVIRASNHRFERAGVPITERGHDAGTIVIEDDVWIGANVVVLPKVVLGAGAVVAAGAVVTKDFKRLAVVGGVPALQIASRGIPPPSYAPAAGGADSE